MTVLRRGLLERFRTWAKDVARALVPSRLLVEARRLRDLSPPAKYHYVRRIVSRVRARAALPRFDHGSPVPLLFVCHGNVMRSAVAAAMFRSKVKGTKRTFVVQSAGTHARSGSPADPRMCAAAALAGISLDSHRATPISVALVHDAHAIFVMDYLNEAELLARVPSARSKVYLLGTFGPSPQRAPEISDPFMSDADASCQCARQIEACVGGLVAALERSE